MASGKRAVHAARPVVAGESREGRRDRGTGVRTAVCFRHMGGQPRHLLAHRTHGNALQHHAPQLLAAECSSRGAGGRNGAAALAALLNAVHVR